jgi:glycosyltransferase involved in cell wall biosynthesis
VVITPVRNEARYIGRTIESMVAQTVQPCQWVIVDDGSTDGTADILNAAARVHEWIIVVRRPDRGFRKSGGGVVEAFYDGYYRLGHINWEFLVKLDGDLSFEPDYFERCIKEFALDPELGIGGGTIFVAAQGQLQIDCADDPPFHVRGATKIYRRACWEQIGPLAAAPGWDTIDEVTANRLGWHTRSFRAISLIQHRTTGAVDGKWATWFKNGRANYVTGYHPAFMLAKCVKCVFVQPGVVAPVALLAGFCSGYFAQPRVADSISVRYLRQHQIRRLLLRPGIYGQSWKREKTAARVVSQV